MNGHFSVDVDPARHLVLIRLSGFFTLETMNAFVAARNEAHRRLRCGPNEHATVADVREMAIQAQELVSRCQVLLADPVHRSRRLAIVTPSTLARTQAHRAAGNRDARFFDDLDEAIAWALEPGTATRTAA